MEIEVTLESMIGHHKLSGVDFGKVEFMNAFDRMEDANAISFVLDEKTYTAVEDPDDGYRSSMDRLFQTDAKLKNTFKPIDVLAVNHEELLNFFDINNGKLVLSIGTNYDDTYYPVFVAEFIPENMSINENLDGYD